MADPAADYLRSLNTSDRVRAAAWDAVYAPDDTAAQKLLQQLPFADDVRANLWDLRKGGTLTGTPEAPKPASAEQFTEQAPQPEGSATSRYLSNAGEMLNPVTIAQGLYGAARHPVDTLSGIASASGQQLSQASDAYQQGRYMEAAGHALGATPLIGPVAAQAGEQIASGDIAGGLGKATGLLLPIAGASAVKGAVRGAAAGARAAAPGLAAKAADALEGSAASKVADVMSQKVGANKVRFGNQAEKVAPQIAKDLAADGAPLTREGLHSYLGGKLSEAEQGLDAADQARGKGFSVATHPILQDLKAKLATLTAAPTQVQGQAVGSPVIAGPNAARAAVIQQAIQEIDRLGPVADYDALRTLRQAYDVPAKTTYSPSMTADYLKANGGKLGAADVTGVLRDRLAQMDPQTAAANAQYHVYRTANDVLEATREIERTRPRVGRLIANRIFGTVAGSQAGGGAGAVAGYIAAPFLDAGSAAGFTTKLKAAALQQQLAEAIRGGNLQQVNTIADQIAAVLKREAKTTAPVEAERERRTTSPSGYQSPTTAPQMP